MIAYDAAGRVTAHWTAQGGASGTLLNTWDAQSRRTKVEFSGTEILFGYNGDGQLDSLTDVNGDVSAMGYNADLQAEEFGYPGGVNRRRFFKYPTTHRTAEVRWSMTPVDDAFGHLLTQDAMKRYTERAWVGVDTTRLYQYDAAGRLHSYQDWELDSSSCTWDPDKGNLCPGGNALADSVNYSYDNVGNRTDHNATVETGNRLTSYDGYTLTWDDAGFLEQKAKPGFTQDFYWNARGQLDSVSTNGTVSRYKYDGLGRRIETDIDGVVRRYLHDGDDVFVEYDGSWNVVAEYTTWPGTDRLHSRRDSSGAVSYYAPDPQGTVLGLFAGGITIQTRYWYDPWGMPEGTAVENVENPFRYLGRPWDEVAGLLYLRARYYDPEIGRFISEDPIGLQGGINPYVYASNDPINRTDRSGLTDECPEDEPSGDVDNPDTWWAELPEICVEISQDDPGEGGGGPAPPDPNVERFQNRGPESVEARRLRSFYPGPRRSFTVGQALSTQILRSLDPVPNCSVEGVLTGAVRVANRSALRVGIVG
ncbi:MAG: RHS repeat-associated core domain-containing protein, partial [Halobacteriales archaeon]|nr:RHS repeat-associated core domain-containing protein [Halobacteriales archaeon]